MSATTQKSTGKPRVVLLGGGNGTSRLLRSLVPLLQGSDIASLHALVLNADDGGSTGKLRQQYAVSAMGDLSRCLVALSSFHGDTRGEQLLNAMDYRFESGDFVGHTLRNIFLTSLERTSDIDSGIAMMARILQIPKEAGVVPLTLTPLTQQVVITHSGAEQLLGEGQHFISHRVNLQADPRWQPGDVRVRFAEREAQMNPRARDVLGDATHIIVAPGHTYGTILPTLALPAVEEIVAVSQAHVSVVMTLLTTPQQTTGWAGEDFLSVYESYLGRAVDLVVANTGTAPIELVPDQEWVRFADVDTVERTVFSDDLVASELPTATSGDVVPRAVVVHDTEKLGHIYRDLLTHE